MTKLRSGIVIQARSGHHRVQDDDELVTCSVRGRLKQERLYTDLIATGDRVRWRLTRPGRGVIEEILPRETQLSRLRPGPGQMPFEHVIVANPDQTLFIFAVREPTPRLRMLDRLLVIAENNDLPAIICANKIDLLADERQARALFGIYAEIGYEVIFTSARTGQGIAALRERLQDRLSVLCGPSGVGKSSLLNAVQSDLGLAAREISEATGKGRHTTVGVRLWPLDEGGYVADTPGLREAGFFDIEPEELAWHFVEMRPFLSDCHFSSCTHTHEPDCAVKAAVEAGKITEARYDSYRRLFAGE
ncbi:MAG: ribosome small subunit-dependent GTPase A [Anaerolineae bacterium]